MAQHNTPQTQNNQQPPLCPRCEEIPQPCHGPGQLFLWFPIQHSSSKLAKFLRQNHFAFQPLEHESGLAIELPSDLAEFAEHLTNLFTKAEMSDIRSLFKKEHQEPSVADFSSICSLKEWVNFVKSNWLINILQEKRLTSLFQPIVNARNTNAVFAHECLLRGLNPDGSIVPPGAMFGLARECSLLFQMDQAARRTALQCAENNGVNTILFINFNPSSIYDPVYCLQTTFRLIENLNMDSKNIVFEVVESDQVVNTGHLTEILNHYREKGFRVALDDIGSGYSSLNMVHQLHPDFIKLDMELIRDVHKSEMKAVVARKILEIAHELGIKTIAEGIETKEELAWVQANGADYLQGYYIAKPATLPGLPT